MSKTNQYQKMTDKALFKLHNDLVKSGEPILRILVEEVNVRRAKTERQFLCVEDSEQFTIFAKDIEDARDKASVYNGEVIRELV